MTTISTHQTIGTTGTIYTVRTDDGRTLGSYLQDHGADVVHSDDLPEADNGVVGPIEAIAAMARAAGVRGFKLSDEGAWSYSSELMDWVAERATAHGGPRKVYLNHVLGWGDEIGVSAAPITGALMAVMDREREAVAA